MDNVAYGISTPSPEAVGSRENPVVFPWTEGLSEPSKNEFIVLPWNDLALIRKTVESHYKDLAGIITEPIYVQ